MYEHADLLCMQRLLGFHSSPLHPPVLSVCPPQTAETQTRLRQDLCKSCSLGDTQGGGGGGGTVSGRGL